MLSVYEIETQILCLRARPVDERLIESFEVDSQIEQAWVNDILRREREALSGKVQMVSGQEAIARVRAGIA